MEKGKKEPGSHASGGASKGKHRRRSVTLGSPAAFRTHRAAPHPNGNIGRSACGRRITRVALQESSEVISLIDRSDVDYTGIVDQKNNTLLFNGESYSLPLEGIHNASNFLIALAVASELNVHVTSSLNLKVSLPPGRSKTIRLSHITIYDETYNASPESVKASLDLLATREGRRIAVIGAMHELGGLRLGFHRDVIMQAIQLDLDGLIMVIDCPELDEILDTVNKPKLFDVTKDVDSVIPILKSWLKNGDNLLLKASRVVQLESLIPALRELY